MPVPEPVAHRIVCVTSTAWISISSISASNNSSLKDLEALYVLTTTWTGWIDAHSSDYRALADLPPGGTTA